MRGGSLFSGIGGLDLGCERAGIETAWQVEFDKDCARLLSARFPKSARYGDVRHVGAGDAGGRHGGGEGAGERVDGDGADALDLERGPRDSDRPEGAAAREALRPVDVVTGGFPCQDLSVAGKRAGLAGDRSGLWFEFHRILSELRPEWVVIENVPGLLSSVCACPGDGSHDAPHQVVDADGEPAVDGDGEPVIERGPCRSPHGVAGGACEGGCFPAHGGAMGLLTAGLAELGYGWAYRVLDAQYFGVAQRRRRVFVVGRLGDAAGPAQVLFEPESCDGDTPPSRAKREGPAGTLGGGSGERGWPQDTERMTFVPEVSRAISGANDPQAEDQASYVADVTGTLSVGAHPGVQPAGQDAYSGQLVAAPLDTRNRDNPEHETFVAAPLSAGSSPNSNASGRRREDDENLVPALTQESAYKGEAIAAYALRSDASRDGEARTPSADAEGRVRLRDPGFNVEEEWSSTLDGGQPHTVAHALSAEGSDASEDGTGRGTPLVAQSLSENQRAEVKLTDVARQLTSGGGKPGQGYPAIAVRTAQTSSNGWGVDEEGRSYTLDETGGGAVASPITSEFSGGGSNPVPGRMVPVEMAVRRLTPTECERLQGFPDGWTEGFADSTRYRMLGNAVCVNVAEWIMGRVAAVHAGLDPNLRSE